LRRIAGSLFWASRYLERALWRARLVDVNYHLLLEVPPRDADPWEPLVNITGEHDAFFALHSRADEASVIDFFTFDRRNPSSIRSCLESVRTNLSPLRYLVSSELWVAVNRLYLEVRDWSPASLGLCGVSPFFNDLKDRFFAITGIVSNTLSRDLVYDLVEIGTMLERIDNVSRLLDVKYHYLMPRLEDVGGPADLRQWAAVLRSASALEAFRNTYGNSIRVNRVVEFLVFDPAFPRSMRACIETLAAALTRIASETGNDPVAGPQPADHLLSILRKGCARDTIANGLHEFLVTMQRECANVADQIFNMYMSYE
jgi:uncharacterized alpha-E superfamily protein